MCSVEFRPFSAGRGRGRSLDLQLGALEGRGLLVGDLELKA